MGTKTSNLPFNVRAAKTLYRWEGRTLYRSMRRGQLFIHYRISGEIERFESIDYQDAIVLLQTERDPYAVDFLNEGDN